MQPYGYGLFATEDERLANQVEDLEDILNSCANNKEHLLNKLIY